MREYGVVRKILEGDKKKSVSYMGIARKLLGQLKQRMTLTGVEQLSHKTVFPDKTVIVVSSVFGRDTVRIFVPFEETTSSRMEGTFGIWIYVYDAYTHLADAVVEETSWDWQYLTTSDPTTFQEFYAIPFEIGDTYWDPHHVGVESCFTVENYKVYRWGVEVADLSTAFNTSYAIKGISYYGGRLYIVGRIDSDPDYNVISRPFDLTLNEAGVDSGLDSGDPGYPWAEDRQDTLYNLIGKEKFSTNIVGDKLVGYHWVWGDASGGGTPETESSIAALYEYDLSTMSFSSTDYTRDTAVPFDSSGQFVYDVVTNWVPANTVPCPTRDTGPADWIYDGTATMSRVDELQTRERYQEAFYAGNTLVHVRVETVAKTTSSGTGWTHFEDHIVDGVHIPGVSSYATSSAVEQIHQIRIHFGSILTVDILNAKHTISYTDASGVGSVTTHLYPTYKTAAVIYDPASGIVAWIEADGYQTTTRSLKAYDLVRGVLIYDEAQTGGPYNTNTVVFLGTPEIISMGVLMSGGCEIDPEPTTCNCCFKTYPFTHSYAGEYTYNYNNVAERNFIHKAWDGAGLSGYGSTDLIPPAPYVLSARTINDASLTAIYPLDASGWKIVMTPTLATTVPFSSWAYIVYLRPY